MRTDSAYCDNPKVIQTLKQGQQARLEKLGKSLLLFMPVMELYDVCEPFQLRDV